MLNTSVFFKSLADYCGIEYIFFLLSGELVALEQFPNNQHLISMRAFQSIRDIKNALASWSTRYTHNLLSS